MSPYLKSITVLRCPSAAANSKGEQLSKPAVRIEGPNLTNCSFDETTILRDQNNLAAWANFRKGHTNLKKFYLTDLEKGHLATSILTHSVLPLMEAALKGFTRSSWDKKL